MKHLKHLLLIAVLAAQVPLAAVAQSQSNLPCGTPQAMERIFKKYPERKQQWLNRRLAPSLVAPTSMEDSVLVIPVVVHVIHNNGPENVSVAQVQDMIRIINEDFARMSSDTNQIDPEFRLIAGKGRVEFRLAKKDPDGNCTIGITRTQSVLTSTADDNVKDLIGWNTSQYFNIWVVRSISFGAGAYAYYPGTINQEYEGVVCLASQFGSIGASSSANFSARTMTHEIGHYFNLPHTWGDSNEPGVEANCFDDDGVEDTPNTVGVTAQNCNKNMMSCGVRANVENYMDYSNCGRMFTNGQVERMRTALFSPIADRNQLWTLANRIATGTNNGYLPVPCAPIAAFGTPFSTVCSGRSVSFQSQVGNVSTPTEANHSWTFEGGTPATSQEINPMVTYSNAGNYAVKLVVSNASGKDSVIMDNRIRVNAGVPTYSTSLGSIESFETPSFPDFVGNFNKNWFVESPAGTSWVRTVQAATEGSASVRIDNRNIPSQTLSALITSTFDIASIQQPAYLSFNVAFARTATTNRDALKVLVSTDCGRTWLPLAYNKTAISITAPLSTTGAMLYPANVSFVPTATQWRKELINVSNYAIYSGVRFKFEMNSRGGNILYLDEVSVVNQPVLSTADALREYQVKVAPNPFDYVAQLSYTLSQSSQVAVELTDLLGRSVWQQAVNRQEVGNQVVNLPSNLARGMYVLRLQIDSQRITQKIIKE